MRAPYSQDRAAREAEIKLIRERVSCIRLAQSATRLQQRGPVASGLCPFHTERTPSFQCWDDHYHCFGCGAHGDAFDLVMKLRQLNFAQAVAALRVEAGLNAGGPPSLPRHAREIRGVNGPDQRQRQTQLKREDARRIWAQTVPVRGTPVEDYLRGRGLRLDGPGDWPRSIRFVPELVYPYAEADGKTRRSLPAMVAVIQGADDFLMGVHVTYLARGGSGAWLKAKGLPGRNPGEVGPAKMTTGLVMTGAVRLAPAGPVLLLGEGKETVLSVMAATGLPGWAALSLHNLCGRALRDDKGEPTAEPDSNSPGAVLPSEVREVVLLADSDTRDAALLERSLALAARRFALQGRRVRVARPGEGEDFNDMLQRLQSGAAAAEAQAAQAAKGLEAFTVGDLNAACARLVVGRVDGVGNDNGLSSHVGGSL